jgi:hypothetical protein
MLKKFGGVFGRNPVFNRLTVAGEAIIAAIKGNLLLSDGNLVQGTAGKGINFTANTPAAGMTSELLNWYEEGTWTPTYSGWVSNPTVVSAQYTRIGRQVTLTAKFFSGVSANGSLIFGIPFTILSIKYRYFK